MRNKQKFKSDLSDALKEAQMASFKASFEVNLSEDEGAASMQQKIAKAGSDKFAEIVSQKLPNIIDDYLDSLEFDVSKLMSPQGPVTGKISII